MNPKNTAPLLVTLAPLAAAAPPLIIGFLIGGTILLVLKSFLSSEEAKPDVTGEANAESRKPVETVAFRQIPAEIPAKLPAVPVASVPRLVVPPSSAPLVPIMSAPVPAPQKIAAQLPPLLPIKRKIVGREDMTTVFGHGTRTLNRTDAVAALKRLGFGKTAAYAALSPDGRFSAWLQCAADGIITWTDGRTA